MTNPEIYKTANAIGPAIGYAISDGVESFQGIFGIRDGEPGQFTTYTRSGLAYAESPSGAVIEVPQDVPPYEYVDGEKRARFYAGTGVLPFPPGTSVTVEPATTSILARDVDDASYLFDAAESDCVVRDPLAEISKSQVFSIAVKAYITDITTEQTLAANSNTTNDRFALGIKDGLVKSSIYVGSVFISPKSGAASIGEHSLVVTYDGGLSDLNLYIDKITQVGTGAAGASSTDKLSFGSSTDCATRRLSGAMWQPVVYDRVLTTQEITDYQNGVLPANPILQPDFHSYRKDTLVKDLSGNGLDLTASRTVDNLIQENQGFGYPVNKKALKPWKSSIGTPYGLKDLFGGVDGNNAVGNGKMFKHTIYDLSANVVLWEGQNGTDILYFDSADNLIKLTDGTNTAVSDSVVVASTEFTVIPEWNDTEMWIIKDGSQGTKVTFAGTFPALGNRLLIIPDGVYQTNRDVLFNDRLIGS